MCRCGSVSLSGSTQMTESRQQRVRFTPERYRREASGVRREAEVAESEAVRQLLLALAEQFDAVAEAMERS